MDRPVVVALFHSDPERIALVRSVLSVSGFAVASVLTTEILDGRCDVASFLLAHDPGVVVYDVGPPYGQNWRVMERIRAMTGMRDRGFLITSSDPHHVKHLAGRDETIYGVVGGPYDLTRLAQIVKETSRARPTRDAGHIPLSLMVPTVVLLERRYHSDRRDQRDRRAFAAATDLYRRLRSKRAEMETDRRRGSRRADETK